MPITNRDRMASRAGNGGLSDLVIPEVPRLELPSRAAKAFPELAEWNRKHGEEWARWRERANAVFTRLPASSP